MCAGSRVGVCLRPLLQFPTSLLVCATPPCKMHSIYVGDGAFVFTAGHITLWSPFSCTLLCCCPFVFSKSLPDNDESAGHARSGWSSRLFLWEVFSSGFSYHLLFLDRGITYLSVHTEFSEAPLEDREEDKTLSDHVCGKRRRDM